MSNRQILLKDPESEQFAIELPIQAKFLTTPFSGSVCSKSGVEFKIDRNIIDALNDEKIEKTLAQMTNYLKLTASSYEDLWRVNSLSVLTGEDFPIKEEAEILEKWIDVKEGDLILDAGCSTALYARLIYQMNELVDIVAIDFSSEMLREAKKRAIKDEADIYLLKANVENLPIFANTFDHIVCGGTLNEFNDPLKALYECKRTLKKEGSFFIMHLLSADSWYGIALQQGAKIGGIKFWTLDESNKLFERAGFKVEKQKKRGVVCFSLLTPQN